MQVLGPAHGAVALDREAPAMFNRPLASVCREHREVDAALDQPPCDLSYVGLDASDIRVVARTDHGHPHPADVLLPLVGRCGRSHGTRANALKEGVSSQWVVGAVEPLGLTTSAQAGVS